MRFSEIVPGATYCGGGVTRRVIKREGVVRITERSEPDFYDDDNVIHARKGIQEGIYSGNPSNGSYRDLTEVTVVFLEGDLTTPKECSIQEFADWAESRVG